MHLTICLPGRESLRANVVGSKLEPQPNGFILPGILVTLADVLPLLVIQ